MQWFPWGVQRRRHPRGGSSRPAWLASLLALAVLVLSAGAHAHGIAAPMCDPVGASVVAPIPALPIDGGEIRALLDCSAADEADALGAAQEQLQADPPSDTVEPGVPARFSWVGPSPERGARPEAARAPVRPSIRWSVYRPPRG